MNVVRTPPGGSRRPVARLTSTPPGISPDSGYPWNDGDMLYAGDLNAAIALVGTGAVDAPNDGNAYGRVNLAWSQVVPIGGGTLTGPLVLAGDPVAALGAATKQYVDGHLPVGGPFLPLSGGTLSGNLNVNGTLQGTHGAAPGAGGIVDTWLIANNTGANYASGHRFDYNNSGGNTGFHVGMSVLGFHNPTFIAGQTPAFFGTWHVSQSPNDTTHNWSCQVGEFNIVNRGLDRGWMRDRTSANPTGGVLVVPETAVFDGTGGEGKNATFGYSIAHSGGNNSTGFPAKLYNGYLVEPNAIAGLTGRGIYATGDITGTASQYPYGPMQLDGTWLHGIDHTKAIYTDGASQTMLVGQAMRWITGTTASPTAVVSVGGLGTAPDVSMLLTTAGAGTVQIGTGTGVQSLTINGATGQFNGVNWQTAGNNRWRLVTDASDNLTLYAFNPAGTFVGTVLAFNVATQVIVATGNFQCQGHAGFNGTVPIAKPTVSGAKGSNAALASLMTALAAYGLVTDSTTA